MPLRPIAIIVPVRSGIPVRLEAPAGHFSGTTNGDGYVVFPTVPGADQMPQANLFVDDPTSEFYGIVIDVPEGGHQFFVGQPPYPVHPPFDIVLPALVPKPQVDPGHPSGTLPSLDMVGRDFFDNGKRSVLIGTDQFLAFRYFRDRRDLTPFFQESKEIGFNTWRVHFQGSIRQNGVLQLDPKEPGFYEDVRPFAQLLNSQGIVLLGNIGVDNQDIQSPPAHWTRMYQELEGTRSIASKANEWQKNLNGLTPADLPNPTGRLLWSQGSGLEDQAPFKPTGPVMEFHPVRTFTTAMRDAVASPVELFEVQGYGNVRLLFDEPGRMGSQRPSPAEFGDPKHCYEYARIASTLAAGLVFHNWPGQSGQLMDEGTKACARGFVRGMTL